jgi:hypothetical protein
MMHAPAQPSAVLAKGDVDRIEADAGILGIDLSTPASVPEPGTLTLLGGALLLWLVGAFWFRSAGGGIFDDAARSKKKGLRPLFSWVHIAVNLRRDVTTESVFDIIECRGRLFAEKPPLRNASCGGRLRCHHF